MVKVWKRLLMTPVLFAGCVLGTPASGAVLATGISATDFDASSTFGFSFFTPIAPLFGLVSYTATVGGTLTDATGDGISASVDSPAHSSIFGFSINGAEFLGDGLGNVSASFGPVHYSGIFDCGVAGCVSLGSRVNFVGSGAGDLYSIQTNFELIKQPVPEPGTLALLGLGLAGLAATRRRKQ